MEGFHNIYKGKTVFVTGHTGFKGSWLTIWLHELGAKVIGYGLAPYTEKDNFVLSGIGERIVDIRGDIRDKDRLEGLFRKYHPEFVFHLAAQPLVRASYDCPVETYETNVMGTIHVLEAMRNCESARAGIFVTTDKCYENKEQLWGYRECDPLGGHDPYSSSKGAAEIAINSWRLSFLNPQPDSRHPKAIASVRAGNVIGGGDWAEDRIIPDSMRSLEVGRAVEIRSPQSLRPWEHVLEPLGGYLLLGEKLYENPLEFSEAWNFGPNLTSVIPVWEIAKKVICLYGGGELKDCSDKENVHEAKLLALDISKARFRLNWQPTWNIQEALKFTVDWYKKYNSEDVYGLCRKQIIEFSKKGDY